ncbi:SGNH/GDSL hydrolase family protein [Tautonia sociabilis]|nr:SGNH/GDSL hydrolase family protein [Tautonia sociabilis]
MWAVVRSLSLSIAASAVPALVRPGLPVPRGVGAIGDSYTDEYRFYEPDRATALSWVELLSLARGLNFGPFSMEDLGPPRHRGFAFNWARSGATSDDGIAEGQHTGLASQIASGEVDLAYVFLGGNDFIEALDPDRSWSPATMAGIASRAGENLERIVGTLLDASPSARVIVATVPGLRGLPEIRDRLALGLIDRGRLDAASQALRRFNAGLRGLVRRSARVGLADLELEARVAEAVLPRFVRVGGRWIDRQEPGNGPGHLFLADGRHVGTVGQGLIAQRFVRSAFVQFGLGIRPLSHREIVALAGSTAPMAEVEPALAAGGS